jgi:hypothetical protein
MKGKEAIFRAMAFPIPDLPPVTSAIDEQLSPMAAA